LPPGRSPNRARPRLSRRRSPTPEQDLPHLLELLLQPVVGRGCRQEAAVLPLVGAEANDVAGVADSDCPS
jgi:hypothetical protein